MDFRIGRSRGRRNRWSVRRWGCCGSRRRCYCVARLRWGRGGRWNCGGTHRWRRWNCPRRRWRLFRRHCGRSGRLWRNHRWFCLYDHFDFRGRYCRSRFLLGARDPVFRRKRDSPDISSCFEFQADLKQLPNRSRPLHPHDMAGHDARRKRRLHARNFQGDDGILGDVVLGLVFAAVAVNHHRGGAFFEWLPERVDARYRDGNRLYDARAPALLRAGIARWQSRFVQLDPPRGRR